MRKSYNLASSKVSVCEPGRQLAMKEYGRLQRDAISAIEVMWVKLQKHDTLIQQHRFVASVRASFMLYCMVIVSHGV